MATYYVRTTGSDAAAGTSAATAWLTIGKAMGTAVADGDTVYVGAGTYRITATIAPATHASMTYLYGDTDGSKTGDAGEVVVSNYGTNDTTAPNAVALFTFASKSFWTLGKLTLLSGNLQNGIVISGTSASLTFQDLTFLGGGQPLVSSSVTFGTVQNITIERCRFVTANSGVQMELPGSGTGSGDINANIVIRNSLVLTTGGATPLYFTTTAGTARKTGGVSIANVVTTGTNGVYTSNNNVSTTNPITVYNSLIFATGACLSSGALGQIVEDYNVLIPITTARTNVSAGTNSKSDFSRMWRFSLGHEASFGGVTRSWGEFPSGSPLLTWGGTAVPTDDINGVTRPASGASQASTAQALGPFERSNSATRETTTTRTGGTAIKLAGPGYHDFELAVSPVQTNVSVWSYKDANYGTAATAPQLIITNAGEAGFGGTTITSAGGTGAWAAMTATFTPTSAGIVTVRLQSNATVGSAAAYFDDFSVT